MIYIASIRLPEERGRRGPLETSTGRGLLRMALAASGAPAPGVEELEGMLGRSGRGKPYFAQWPYQKYHFSISHSHGLVACALAETPVGLDVERVRAFSPALAERVCAPGERAMLERAADPDSFLTRLWTCKESYMKYTGLGMAQGVAETAFSRLEPTPVLVGREGLHINSIRLLRGGEAFWLTLCGEEPGPLAVRFVG